ncbi:MULTISPECIES: DUF4347 domain-containing protein [Cyanophyceae]|uniref:DUF4347 domain-containing protein n=1 Tax=Leptolyngbya subtilissima DQ-A4 TaxID=2933933 RepID=A0ABV0K0M5_9CYAN|nr:DUF4347 domain-containing protein [Nodosilinea sp. FACHB-141]MBD2112118.1 DUF4347 domain-containing protein [Nodosilinea sp. FACHB-141]
MFQHAQSVVFIDASVSDVPHLVSGVLPGVAVKVLAADVDGVAQITNYLEAYPASTVHIVSHGAPGVLYLGNTQLNLTNLENYAQALRSWFSPQASNPTLLLYGCNVAAGDAGEELIEKLHQLTGADIAASRQVIGQGYWSLEVSPTQTTALAPFSTPVLASWAGKLAPIINNLSNSSYSEQGPAYILDNDITFSGGTNYKNGYIEFSLGTATSFDFLTLATDGSPAIGNGQISIVGNAVYVGNGSAASVIGNVDSTFDGQNGQKLRINFSAGFENGNFNLGTSGSTTITGWTGVNQQVRFGIDTIAGLPTPVDTTFPGNNVDRGQNIPQNPGTFSTVLSSTQNDGGGNSVQLRSTGITTKTGYDIVRGPSIYSNGTVQLSVGDQVSFEWQAQGGGDAYDVYGYLVDVNTNNIVTILNQTGNSDTASTTWAKQTVNITQSGEYRFVFVAGTFDFTGGRAAGAQLFIDDVVVTQAVPPVNPNDSILSAIAQRVQYNNTSDAPETSKTLTVSAKNNLGETASGTATITITPVNDLPTGTVTINGTLAQGQTLTANTSTLADADGLGTLNYQWQQSTDGITWATIAGATANTFTLTQAQVNQFVRSQVSYTDGDGSLETVNSNATAAKVNGAPTGGVTVAGTVEQGSLLTATSTLGDPNGLGTLNYQWQQSTDGMTWTTISGATASTFTLTQAQVGQFVRSQVSYTDGGGNLETVNSNATATKVANVNDAPMGGIAASGTATQNAVLTVDTSALSDADGLGALNYQWQQSTDGTTWTAITGATASTFTLTQAQVGQFVRSQVSYTDGGGTLETVFSNATATTIANVNDAPGGLSLAKVYRTSIDGYIDNFEVYNPTTNVWKTLNPIATSTQLAVSSNNELYMLNDNTNIIQRYNPDTDTWVDVQAGPNVNWDYGNLEVTNNNEFILTAQGQTTLYYTQGGTWNSLALPGGASTAADYDPVTGKFVVGQFSQYGAWEVNLATGTITTFSVGGQIDSGETRRFGEIYDGRYYSQGYNYPIYAYDLANNTLALQQVSPAYNSVGNWLSAAVDAGEGLFYLNGFNSTNFSSWDPVTNTFVALAPALTASGHNTLAATSVGAPVTLSGAPQQNSVLTANTSNLVDLDGLGVLNYQWQQSSDGITWTAIAGATASTFTLTQERVGQFVRARVSYVDGFGAAEEVFSAPTASKIANVNDLPTGGVTLTGNAEQGSLLTATPTPDFGDLDGLGTLNYQWQQSSDGTTWTTIAGATASTFTLTQAQVGQFVRSQVSFTDGGGSLETVNSNATAAKVANVNDAPTGGVTLNGTGTQGQTLTANTSNLSDADGLGTLNYQWQQSTDGNTWTTIAGATANTFTLTQAQVNQFVRSQVSYTDGGGSLETVNSNATAAKVANVNDAPTGSVTVNGTVAQGQILTANTSTLADADGLGTLSYQWKQSSDGITWSNIAGATGNTFSPRNAQVSQFLQVAVSYVDGQGTSESLTSAPTSGSVAKFNATSDFNNDGSVDIFWRHQSAGQTVFWLMDNINFAGGDFLSPTIEVKDVNWDIKALGDLNGDGKADLVWQNKATNQAAVWLMDGVNLTSGALLPNDAASGWKVVESGNFNKDTNVDKKDDLLWRNANTGELAVWFMNGTNFVSGEFITVNAGLDWEVGAVGDFTKDGKTDIFWENRITGANVFWEMDGATFVKSHQTTAAAAEWKAKGAADFNQDGNLDLLWHNPGTGENALWLMNGTNLVEGVTTLPTTDVSWNPVV